MSSHRNDKITRDSKGRFCGKGAYPCSETARETDYTPISQAEQKLEHAFEKLGLELQRADGAGVGVPTVVLRASPGAGKSTVQRKRLAAEMMAGGGDRVVVHVPTLALAQEAADEAIAIGIDAQAIRGRAATQPGEVETMCKKSDVVEQASRLGISVRENFCVRTEGDGTVRRCQHFEDCAYMAQFRADAPLVFMATTYVGLPDPSGFTNTHRIIDETF